LIYIKVEYFFLFKLLGERWGNKTMKKSFLKIALLSSVLTTSFTGISNAQEFEGVWDKDRFQIRGRMIGVLADCDGIVNGTALDTNVDHAYVPEVDITYFFTKNIAAELIAATSEHTITAGGNVLGDAWILPPTLTLQYHFQPDDNFSPYIGAGLNYSMFYGEDDGDGFNNLDVDGGIGYAVQAGFDYWINDNWGVNFDVKYIDLDVDVRVNNSLSADNVKLDPVIVGFGTSYRF
jgi:outer membrane protein